MSTIRDLVLARFDNFVNRIQGFQPSRVQQYRREPFKSAEPKRAVALFGASPDGFALDYVSYRSPQPQGPATQPQPLQSELRENDEDIEKWHGPNPNVPSLISHGKRLDYSRGTDQEPIRSFSGTIDEKWDGLVRNIPKKPDFQSVRTKREPTIAMHTPRTFAKPAMISTRTGRRQ